MSNEKKKLWIQFFVIVAAMILFMAAFDYMPLGLLAPLAIVIIIASFIFVIKGTSIFVSDLKPKKRRSENDGEGSNEH